MTSLSRSIVWYMVSEFGREFFLRRLSDPYWFQALGSVLAFDWHSSGLTTTVTGALKQGLKGMEKELGMFMAGGKGAASRKTPEQISSFAESNHVDPGGLIYASRMSAKADNSAVQDGYQLYHHVFAFSIGGSWAVVQQGMNPTNRTARRYHWLSEDVKDLVVQPHTAICCDRRGQFTLNMTSRESGAARQASSEIARLRPEKTLAELKAPLRHTVTLRDINPDRLKSILLKTYEAQPPDFEALLGIRGVGPKTIRSLSLLSELLYGATPDYADPARFSFAHGGKDGTPYPVDRRNYDRTIEVMQKAIQAARVGHRERMDAIRKLHSYFREET
jgi:hypothetical protein